MEVSNNFTSERISSVAVQRYIKGLEGFSDIQIKETFKRCLLNTLETTVRFHSDGTTHIITGDINALWLRDSSAQVQPYVYMCKSDPVLQKIVSGLIRFQYKCILNNYYANAFNSDLTVWEEKYELDSLCYPIDLTWKYWKITGDSSIFTSEAKKTFDKIREVFRIEQRHAELSNYRHEEMACDGKGGSIAFTGMIWSGFRPSDDPCRYNYFIPGNMFTVVVLGKLAEIYQRVYSDHKALEDCLALRNEIDKGIQTYGCFKHPKYGQIYAYEVDGLGNSNLMDDANIPSLLSIPYLGYLPMTDPIYQNTRRFILSRDNPFFIEGKFAKGIGSPHTDQHGISGSIWHLALIMQILTSEDAREVQRVLCYLANTNGGTYYMHEGFDPDDPTRYSRSWFAWANSLYAEMIITKILGLTFVPDKGTYVRPFLPYSVDWIELSEAVPFGYLDSIRLKVNKKGSDWVGCIVANHNSFVGCGRVFIPREVTKAEVIIKLTDC